MHRIDLLASLCSGSKVLCDVGCDHAYVLTLALEKYNVSFGIAADINEGPLKSAKENVSSLGLTNRVKFILSDGFKNINDSFDTAVIAGMGGNLIKNILESSYDKIKDKKLILEANNDQKTVRLFLMNNGFKIEDEFAIYDNNKYYEIIVATPGNVKYDNKEILYGPVLIKKKPDAFITFYKRKIELLNNVILKANQASIKEEKQKEILEIESIL